MGRPRNNPLEATDSNTLEENRFDGEDGIGPDANIASPRSELEQVQLESEAKDMKLAHMNEELQRLSQVVSLLAKKESIPDGVARKEYLDAEGFVPFTKDGKRFAAWEATGSFEEQIGEAMQKHFVYKITYVDKDGKETFEESIPHRVFKNKLMDAVKVPAILPKFLRRIKEGDHYVNRSASALKGEPIKNEDVVEMILGKVLADGKTRVYEGETIHAKFYTWNAA